ncbi:uncharacterized protein JCM6883_001313 [Sporobolomyces salmoneus]|uniref:uncharacterized protein n=1 Tax=Sporobolomyces salmoneus TaxID=183962 RepID=UPI00316D790E
MTPGLPSTSSLPRQLSSTFDSILSSLSSSIESLTSRTFRASRLSSSIEGLPGTAITETSDFEAVQEYLDCMNGRGEWIYDPSGSELAKEGKGLTVHKMDSKYANCDKRFYKERSHNQEEEEEGEWNIRESLKYRFKPSSTCSLLLPVHLRPERSQDSLIPSRTRFCQLLAHKSVLLLGSTSQYSLHDLILDFTTTEPTSCYGDLYCKEHALCGGILGEKDAEEVESIENWEVDQRVYHRLPLPPAHSSSSQHPYPSTQSSKKGIYPSPTYSTLLRYRRTDGLKPFTYQTLPNYQHPFSGLLEKNQQWLADSRRSDLVILEKPPIALPLKNHNATFDEWFYRYLEDKGVEMEDKVERLLEAVGEVTERVWVPELLEALRSIRSEPSPLDQLVVYRSGWRIQPDCASSSRSDSSWDSPGDGNLPPHSSQPSLSELIYRSSSQTLQPLHVIYHNLQLVFQSHLSRTLILPRFGIISLDLETPLSIWRTGLLGSSTAGKEQRGLKSAVGGDCERYCFPSPGMAIEGAFIGGLERLMEVAWAGVRGKEKEWVGEEFRNLRMRMKDREERA